MSNKDKTHQSPIHGTEESQPGMDSLAPADGSHRPSPGPSAPGEQPTAPGSMKSPDTGNEKLESLEPHRKGGEGFALTTNQGVRIADDQNSLRAGTRGPTLLEDFILREKLPILTTSAYRNASFTRAARLRTGTSSPIRA